MVEVVVVVVVVVVAVRPSVQSPRVGTRTLPRPRKRKTNILLEYVPPRNTGEIGIAGET